MRSASSPDFVAASEAEDGAAAVLPVAPCPYCGRRFFIPLALWRAEDPRARCGDCDGVFDVRTSARNDAALVAIRAGNPATDVETPLAAVRDGVDASGGLDPDEFDYSLAGVDLAAASPRGARARSAGATAGRGAPRRHGAWALGGALLGGLALASIAIPTLYRDAPGVYNERWPRLLAAIGCQALFCELVPPSFPDRFELLRRQVYTHPTRADTLVIELSFTNAADMAQRLPRVELRFANGRGERVGGEDLLPRDYVSGWSPGTMLAPGARQDLQVELPDPGAAASRFDLAFRADDIGPVAHP